MWLMLTNEYGGKARYFFGSGGIIKYSKGRWGSHVVADNETRWDVRESPEEIDKMLGITVAEDTGW